MNNENKIIILGKEIRENYCSGMTARITDKTFDLPLYNISNWGAMTEVKTEYGNAKRHQTGITLTEDKIFNLIKNCNSFEIKEATKEEKEQEEINGYIIINTTTHIIVVDILLNN